MPVDGAVSGDIVEGAISGDIQVVLFRLGKQEFGVPIGQVKEIVMMPEVTPIPNAPNFIEGVINLRGQIIVIIDLSERFDLPQIERAETPRIVVVQAVDVTVGIIVDAAPQVLRLPLADIEPTPDYIASKVEAKYVEGIGKKGDRLFIMLNLEELLSAEEMARLQKVTQNQARPEPEVEKPG